MSGKSKRSKIEAEKPKTKDNDSKSSSPTTETYGYTYQKVGAKNLRRVTQNVDRIMTDTNLQLPNKTGVGTSKTLNNKRKNNVDTSQNA